MQIRNTPMIICTTEIRKNINTAVPVVQFPDLRDYRKPGGLGVKTLLTYSEDRKFAPHTRQVLGCMILSSLHALVYIH